MKKTLRYILYAAAIIAIAASCAKEPNGYVVDKTAVVLEAFGPNPVLRGNTLSFVGQNLDKITSVTLGGENVVVTELLEQTAGGFKITVPSETEAGVLVLTYPGGTITTKTELTFTEPFYITKAEAASSPLKPGDIITITGDYLNNIVGMGFAANQDAFTASEDFESQTRYKIEAPVARGAVSGKIFIQDGNGNQLYSEESFEIVQPTVATASPETVRPGDKVTITGTLFTSVDEVSFPGCSAIVADDFEELTDTKIVVTVPFTVQDGAVSLTTAAGDKIETTNAITVAMPSELAVAAEDVFKAGHNVTITGTNLDLVTGVAFGEASVEFSNDGSKIVTAIPASAVDGPLTLTTASGKTIDTEAITLVKPVISAVSPASIVAGNDITVTGTDLDLVTSVALAGTSLEFDAVSDTEITVHTTATVTSGTIVVKAANGDSAESTAIEVTYDALIIVSSLTSPASVGEPVVMEGSNFNLIETIYFGETKVTGYVERTDTRFEFLIPADLETGTYNPKFVLFNGDEEFCSYSVEVKGAITTVVVWEGETDLGDSWGTTVNLSWDNRGVLKDIPNGAILHIDYEIKQTNPDKGPQLKIMDGNWVVLEGFPANEWGCVDMTAGSTSYPITLTAADVQKLYSTGLVVAGQSVIIKKVYYTYENSGVEPVKPSDIMLNDYEKHGGHDWSWDGSWSGCAEAKEEDGNHFLEVTSESVNAWIINCNHFADYAPALPEGEDISNYQVKIDIFIPSGWAQDGTCKVQLVLGGSWIWWGETFLAGVTGNGKWATYTFEHGQSGTINLSGDTNGLFVDGTSVQAFPVGMKFDNFRLSHK